MLNDIKAQLALAEPPGGESTAAWWKEREHAAAMLTKLTPLLLKIIPAERELTEQAAPKTPVNISKTDREIIERYVLRERAKYAAKHPPDGAQKRDSA